MNSEIDKLTEAIYTNGFGMFEGFFEAKESDELLAVLQEKETFLKAAGIGKDQNYAQIKEIRSDKILWLETGTNECIDRIFFNKIDEIRQALNRRCFLGINDFEFHFAKYEPGTFYKRHKDVFNSDDARKISLIVYLNKNWKEGDGGELKIYSDEKIITVQPKSGTLVLFESHLEHEVMMSNTNRYSITGWLKNSALPF